MTTPILVTGGSGTLGRHVVSRLRAAGRDVRVLSRRTRESEDGAAHVVGDLLNGEGIDAAVAGVDTIVHCAGSFKDDVKMTETLVGAASRAGSPHIVYISVVGTDRIPVVGFGRLAFLYFRNKRDAERVVSEIRLAMDHAARHAVLRALSHHRQGTDQASGGAGACAISLSAGRCCRGRGKARGTRPRRAGGIRGRPRRTSCLPDGRPDQELCACRPSAPPVRAHLGGWQDCSHHPRRRQPGSRTARRERRTQNLGGLSR